MVMRSRKRAAGQNSQDREESPLAWLARRRDKAGVPLISDAQFRAGEQLRADYTFALLTPRVTASYDGAPVARGMKRAAPGTGVELADSAIAARERVNRALAAVGPELSGVLVDVWCYLKGLEEAERKAEWPQRTGKVVLRLALTRLARHYRLDEESRGASSGVQHWGARDYRPVIELPPEA